MIIGNSQYGVSLSHISSILEGDKTDYDEQVSNVVTDYIDLARRLKNLAERRGVPKEEINHILDGFASSMNTKGKTRKFKELLEGRFRLTKVVRIDRKDDGNEVHDKVFDYSYKTIKSNGRWIPRCINANRHATNERWSYEVSQNKSTYYI